MIHRQFLEQPFLERPSLEQHSLERQSLEATIPRNEPSLELLLKVDCTLFKKSAGGV
jgi:hypothetical protein